jgi:hypothetical protein
VHLWFERKIPESAETDIDQSECGMIHADVTAALRAITTVADFAAVESPEEFCALSDANVFSFPQSECAHRRG